MIDGKCTNKIVHFPTTHIHTQETHRHRGIATHRHSDTETQMHGETQRHKDTETQEDRDTRDTKTQKHNNTSTSELCIACCEMFMHKSFFILSKRIVAPAAAMVDSRCPVRLQTQLTGEEERDELED